MDIPLMSSRRVNQKLWPWVTLLIGTLLVAGVIAAAEVVKRSVVVNNFEQCRKAGGELLESYPEQCLYKGKTYVNEQQQAPRAPDDTDSYVGMSESEALLRAEKARTAARVVERDGESLPVTMDFVPGRLHFFVKENVVYKVQVEGEEIQN